MATEGCCSMGPVEIGTGMQAKEEERLFQLFLAEACIDDMPADLAEQIRAGLQRKFDNPATALLDACGQSLAQVT